MTTRTILHDGDTQDGAGEQRFAFALLLGDRTILADTRTELLAELIPGYGDLQAHGDMAPEEMAWARYCAAVSLADQLAEVLVGEAVRTGAVDPHSLSEDDINTVMPPDRMLSAPFEGTWGGALPLVLVRSDYVPHTQVPVPTGNVRFVDPTTEATLLDSLVEAGLAELMVLADAA